MQKESNSKQASAEVFEIGSTSLPTRHLPPPVVWQPCHYQTSSCSCTVCQERWLWIFNVFERHKLDYTPSGACPVLSARITCSARSDSFFGIFQFGHGRPNLSRLWKHERWSRSSPPPWNLKQKDKQAYSKQEARKKNAYDDSCQAKGGEIDSKTNGSSLQSKRGNIQRMVTSRIKQADTLLG